MSKVLQKVDIFLSSPSDVAKERQIVLQVVEELNVLRHINDRFQLRARAYEVESPGVVGEAPQRTVDRYMMKAEDADILICVLWSRMGTPVVDPQTGETYPSGSYYEFVHAYQSNQQQGNPSILLYRCLRPIPPSQDLEQAIAVQNFFKQFEGPHAKFQGLYKTYETPEDFAQIVRQDIDQLLAHIALPPQSQAAGADHPRLPFEAQLQTYLRLVSEQLRTVTLRFNVPGNFSTTLEEIAVAPHLSQPTGLGDRWGHYDPTRQWEYEALAGAAAPATYPDLLIMGEAGSGKTFLSQMLCRQLADRFVAQADCPIPIFVSLFELEMYLLKQQNAADLAKIPPIIQFIEQHSRALGKSEFPADFWEDVLRNHRTLLVLDGLDEVSSKDTRAFIVDLIKELQSGYQKLETVITLRPNAFASEMFGLEYQQSYLLPLTREQQIDILQRLGGILKSTLKDIPRPLRERDQFGALLDSPSLKNWLDKPLFLTAAYLQYILEETALKSPEAFIHRSIITLALQDWDAIKFRSAKARYGSVSASLPTEEQLDSSEILAFLGWQLYRQNKNELSIEAVADWVMELDQSITPRQARQLTESKIQQIAHRSRILVVSPQKVWFQHEADIAFFASCNFVSSRKAWPELVNHLPDPAFQRLIFTIHDLLAIQDMGLVDDFLSFLLEQADQQPNRQTHADLIQPIADCLLRLETDPPVLLKEAIINRILKIIQEDKQQATKLRTRIALGCTLGYLGDPRILEKSKMAFVPRGEFYMGYDLFPADRPARRVMVEDFYIDKYPTTNTQFRLFIEAGGYQDPQYWTPEGWAWVQQTERKHPKYWNDPRFNLPNYPVVGVSWYEAVAYARWSGKRLPSEKEWEKAARGSKYDPNTKRLSGPDWAWGNEFRSDYLNCAEGQEPVGGTTPIGIYPAGASPYDVYDMCGNVSEWTADWYKPYPNNTDADSHFGERFKVRRGGGWAADQDFVRCTCRVASLPTADFAVIGFRCCTRGN